MCLYNGILIVNCNVMVRKGPIKRPSIMMHYLSIGRGTLTKLHSTTTSSSTPLLLPYSMLLINRYLIFPHVPYFLLALDDEIEELNRCLQLDVTARANRLW